jgi:RNA polymerase sigma factor (sigma-70 family)
MLTGSPTVNPMFDDVLAAAQDGAGWAFTRLYASLAPAVAGYLRAQGADDPEDLTSEVFIKVLTGCGSFAGSEAQFRSWVFHVAHCRLIDARRAKTRAHDMQPLDARSLHGDQEPTTAAAEDEALGRLATERATELLAELSPDQRDVLALRLLGQLSVQEVAVVLDKPPGAIKALQRRALATLRRRLGVKALGPVGTASARDT